MATTTSLAKKLLLKAGQRAVILNPPTDYLIALEPLPEGVELVDQADIQPSGSFDFVQLFVKHKQDLEEFLPIAREAIKHDGLLWIAYLKGGAKAGTDLNRDILSQAVESQGLSSVTLVSLDEVWSAMRFRPSERVGK